MLRFKKIFRNPDETEGQLVGFQKSDRFIIGTRQDGRIVIIDQERKHIYVEEVH